VRVQGDEVHFIHDTAREFICCFTQKVSPLPQYYADLIALLRSQSFLGYATEYWTTHFQQLRDPEQDLRALTFKVFNSLIHSNALIRLVYF